MTFVTPNGTRKLNEYRFEVTALRRQGPFAVLEGRVTCTKSDEDYCDGEFVLAEGSSTLNTPAGILLIDPAGKKEYVPVTDSKRRPFSSTLTPSMPIGTVYPFYVNYPVPPAGVASLTVVLPGAGQPQIADVPLT